MPELIIHNVTDTGQAAALCRALSERGFAVTANHSDQSWSITADSSDTQTDSLQNILDAFFPKEKTT